MAEADDNRVRESAAQAVNSLDKDPDLLYSLAEWLESQHRNFPQITAERLRERLLFDRVAVLLKTDEGLDLAGCVGWHPDGVKPVAHDDPSILNKLGGNGARHIGPADRRALLNAGLLGNEAKTIIVAPLEHEKVAFGVLLVGQEEPTRKLHTGNGCLDGIGSFARSVAPDIHAWLLLRRLRSNWRSRQSGRADHQALGSRAGVCGIGAAIRAVRPAACKVPPEVWSIRPAGCSAACRIRPANPKSQPTNHKTQPTSYRIRPRRLLRNLPNPPCQPQISAHQPQNPAHQPQNPAHQPQNPAHQPQNPAHQQQNPAHQLQNPAHQLLRNLPNPPRDVPNPPCQPQNPARRNRIRPTSCLAHVPCWPEPPVHA